MKHLIKTTWKLSLVAVCLCVFVPTVGAQVCLEYFGGYFGAGITHGALAVSGRHAYVEDTGNYFGYPWLNIFEFDPGSTTSLAGGILIGGYPDTLDILDIAVSDGFAYVTYFGPWGGYPGGWVGVKVIDVSTPSDPIEVSELPWAAGAAVPSSIDVEGGFAYVSHHPFWGGFSVVTLYVFDVSDPLNPTEVGYATHGDDFSSAIDVAVSGEYAYIADAYSLRVVDVSTPSAPVEVGFFEVPEAANAVEVSGSYAYVIESPAGMWVLDVSNPAAPVDVGFLPTPGTATDVAVSQGFAYVVDQDSGIRAIDVTDPSAPFEVAVFELWGAMQPQRVAVSEGYVYVTTSGGLHVFRECGVYVDGFESGDTSVWSATVP